MSDSPILGIALIAPTQMDKSTTMNDAIVAMEGAANDQLPLNFAAGNVALTPTQYTRFQVFTCSGLAAPQTLTVPLTKRMFAVKNTSAFALTVGGASGTSVIVAAGSGAVIQCDGVNCSVFASGGPGPAGTVGPAGGAINIDYGFVAAITNADPGPGLIALNNAVQNTATAIYLDLMDTEGNDWTAVLDTLDASTSTVKGQIRLFNRAVPSQWILFNLMARITHAGYRELTVVPIEGSVASPFAPAATLSLSFSRTGDAGAGGAGAGTFAGLTGAATYAQLPPEVQAFPLAFMIPGLPAAGQTYNLVLPIAVSIPADFAGTVVFDNTEATADAEFTVNQISGGVVTAIGSVTILPASKTAATLSVQAQVDFAAGDVLQLVAPVQDATLADLSVTFLAART